MTAHQRSSYYIKECDPTQVRPEFECQCRRKSQAGKALVNSSASMHTHTHTCTHAYAHTHMHMHRTRTQTTSVWPHGTRPQRFRCYQTTTVSCGQQFFAAPAGRCHARTNTCSCFTPLSSPSLSLLDHHPPCMSAPCNYLPGPGLSTCQVIDWGSYLVAQDILEE